VLYLGMASPVCSGQLFRTQISAQFSALTGDSPSFFDRAVAYYSSPSSNIWCHS